MSEEAAVRVEGGLAQLRRVELGADAEPKVVSKTAGKWKLCSGQLGEERV